MSQFNLALVEGTLTKASFTNNISPSELIELRSKLKDQLPLLKQLITENHSASHVTVNGLIDPVEISLLRNFVLKVSSKIEELTRAIEKSNTPSVPETPTSGEAPDIDPSEIEYHKQNDYLGQGSFGTVYKGRCRGKLVAVKVPLKQHLDPKQMEEFRNEVLINKKILHPNSVLFMGACFEPGKLMIVTELMHTDMEKLLKSKKSLPLPLRIKMSKDAALGVNWLHGITKVVHRDLKPANLLVSEDFTVKITDFGFSQLKEDDHLLPSQGVARGTPLWMSPEVLRGQEFNEKCDVYSFAIILWQMYTRKDPFSHHSDIRVFRTQVCKHDERPRIPADCPSGWKDLMIEGWHKDFDKRPSFTQIIQRLDRIMLEISISQPEARQFWSEYFLVPKNSLEDKVPWDSFQTALTKIYGDKTPPKDALRKFRELVASKNSDNKLIVTCDRFNSVVNWFGVFTKGGEEGLKILKEICDIAASPWFHSDISKDVAEKRLAHRSDGTFLIRLSATSPEFPLTLSMINNEHRRIRHQPGGVYQFKGTKRSYDTLLDLVANCSSDPELDVNLSNPCPKDEISSSWGYKDL